MDAIERWARAIERAHGGIGPPSRAATVRALCARIGAQRDQHEYSRGLRRGRCRKRSCESRYGIVRVTIDTRMPERTERAAHLECALCGHVWTAAPVPDLRLRDGASPRILLTLIVPPARGDRLRIWRNRAGNAVRVGSDGAIIRNATYTQLATALADWRALSERVILRRDLAREKREAETAADMAEAAAWREQRERMRAIDAALADAESPIA